jgi:hypothetical protein
MQQPSRMEDGGGSSEGGLQDQPSDGPAPLWGKLPGGERAANSKMNHCSRERADWSKIKDHAAIRLVELPFLI